MEHQPLVSIIIITYNSSEYVVETLDSALAQTYPNVEIIVTDDCSTDDTVAVCRQWISNHHDSGRHVNLVVAEHNTGVSGNCNRGFQSSHGEWIKVIAGDDMLAPTAIEDYICFVRSYPEVCHMIANSVHFSGHLTDDDLMHPDKISKFLYRDTFSVKRQYAVISKTFFGSGPTYFIKAEALKQVGGYDERFPMQEDYPLFIKMIGAGYKMMYLDKVTVYKRMVPTSIQYDKAQDCYFSKHQVRVISEYKMLYRKEALGSFWRLLHGFSISLQNAIIRAGNSKKLLKTRLLYLVYTSTDPFLWYARYIALRNKLYQ